MRFFDPIELIELIEGYDSVGMATLMDVRSATICSISFIGPHKIAGACATIR